MKKVVALLLILTMSRVAVAYAATPTTTSNQQSYFFGNTTQGQANLNQVLALLVGPRGVPGPAGVAGKDGFVGLNGQDGKNGLDGAPGAVGPQGPAGPAGKNGVDGRNGAPGAPGGGGNLGSFAVVALGVGDSMCALGGTKIVAVNGDQNYICNRSGGGGDSATVVTALDGISANATYSSTSCQGTTPLGVSFNRSFTGENFVLGNIAITTIEHACDGKMIRFYFKTQTTGSVDNPSGKYALSKYIRCGFTIQAPTAGSANSFQADATDSTACTTSDNASGTTWPVPSNGVNTYALSDISTYDFISKIGFEIV